MFSGPSDNTWMKGDTFLEVASVLVRTNIDDQTSFNSALEVVKRYVRAKIKKGKGKEVAGKGGKLEALEVKYAHLGFQDIFYLARLQLSLPPSAIKLPRPSSPTRKQLMRAKYPLPEEYMYGLDGARLSVSTGIGDGGSVSERGRSNSIRRDSAVSPAGIAALDPQRVTSTPFILPEQPRTPGTYPVSTPGLSRSASSMTGTSGIPTPLPMPSPGVSAPLRSPLALGPGPVVPSMQRAPSGSSSVSVMSLGQQSSVRRAHKAAGGDEGDVKRMLEARIKALQSALDSLDVEEPGPTAANSGSNAALPSPTKVAPAPLRRELPPLPPAPTVPLPPIPLTPSPIRSTTAAQISPQSRMPAFPAPPSRMPDGNLSPTPSMDSDLGGDPFAAPVRSAGQSRADRERAAWLRTQGDLRRIKAEVGEMYTRRGGTPPPTYEA